MKKLTLLCVAIFALSMLSTNSFAGNDTKYLSTKYGKSIHYVSLTGNSANAKVYSYVKAKAENYGIVINATTTICDSKTGPILIAPVIYVTYSTSYVTATKSWSGSLPGNYVYCYSFHSSYRVGDSYPDFHLTSWYSVFF